MNSKAETTRLYGKLSLLWYLIIAAATVALDQISKYLVIWFLKPVVDFAIISGVFHLTYVENRGAAFGMLTDNRWVFMIASVLLIAGVLVFLIMYAREIKPLLGVALAFVLGGGIGNMIDRIAYGFVVDFLNFELIHFAVFNIADSFICIGAGLMLIYMLVFEIREEKKSKLKAENQPEETSEDAE